ncbi:MAG: chemotaxis protein CheX [Zetaproteobacteria bacterium]|nr:chemotaxis protein CheX [Zetaproteobacteria bacterium]
MSLDNDEHDLSDEERETLAELVHIGVGKACDSLNAMLSSQVTWDIPVITLNDVERYRTLDSNGEMVASSLGFQGGIDGKVAILFSRDCGYQLTAVLNDVEVGDVDDEMMETTLNEVTNISVNSIVGSLSNMINQRLHFQTPEFYPEHIMDVFSNHKKGKIRNMVAITTFRVTKLKVKGSFHLVFVLDSLTELALRIRDLNT